MKKEIPNLNEEDINKAISYAFHKPIGKKYEKLNAELKKYNELVNKAISNRERFLDANMKYFAEFEIGDKVYNVKTGETTIVTGHYRYQFNQNKILDDSFNVDCQFENGDNTSRYEYGHPYVSYEDYINRTQKYISKLELEAKFDKER